MVNPLSQAPHEEIKAVKSLGSRTEWNRTQTHNVKLMKVCVGMVTACDWPEISPAVSWAADEMDQQVSFSNFSALEIWIDLMYLFIAEVFRTLQLSSAETGYCCWLAVWAQVCGVLQDTSRVCVTSLVLKWQISPFPLMWTSGSPFGSVPVLLRTSLLFYLLHCHHRAILHTSTVYSTICTTCNTLNLYLNIHGLRKLKKILSWMILKDNDISVSMMSLDA